MRRFVILTCALLAVTSALAIGAPQKKKARKSAAKTGSKAVAGRPVCAKQENQFVTVDEFVKAKREPKIPVSIEGYIVLAHKTGTGSLKLVLVDSVDHVLSAQDANAQASGGAAAIVEAPALKKRAGWDWTAKGMKQFAMFTGPGTAAVNMHDVVPKLRITGFTSLFRSTIDPITGVEVMDDNGDWKAVR